jgi:hypothetical protein
MRTSDQLEAATSGGEFSHSSARSREANSNRPRVSPEGSPWRNGARTPVDAIGWATLTSPATTAIGAPTPVASTAATKSLFVFIDEYPGCRVLAMESFRRGALAQSKSCSTSATQTAHSAAGAVFARRAVTNRDDV